MVKFLVRRGACTLEDERDLFDAFVGEGCDAIVILGSVDQDDAVLGFQTNGQLMDQILVDAERFGPGVVTSSVARRHGVHPNQLYAWRREVREAMGGGWDSPVFTPVVVAQPEPGMAGRRPKEPSCTIEVKIAGAVMRVRIPM